MPPGQYEVDELRVLYVGSIPEFDEETWTLEVYGQVNQNLTLKYAEVRKLPSVTSISNFHCVTGWSKLENKWKGVTIRTLMDMAGVREEAKYVTIECENDYTTALPLGDLLRDDVLLAYELDDNDLPAEYGGPLRIVVPQKYGYKSAKWVRKIKFATSWELGYWEKRGYSNTADPFTDDRFAQSRLPPYSE